MTESRQGLSCIDRPTPPKRGKGTTVTFRGQPPRESGPFCMAWKKEKRRGPVWNERQAWIFCGCSSCFWCPSSIFWATAGCWPTPRGCPASTWRGGCWRRWPCARWTALPSSVAMWEALPSSAGPGWGTCGWGSSFTPCCSPPCSRSGCRRWCQDGLGLGPSSPSPAISTGS